MQMQHTQAHTARRHKSSAIRGLILVLVLDILLAGCIVGGDYIVNLPHNRTASPP